MQYIVELVALGSVFIALVGVLAWVYIEERKRVREKLKEHDDEIAGLKKHTTLIQVIENDVKWIRRELERGNRHG